METLPIPFSSEAVGDHIINIGKNLIRRFHILFKLCQIHDAGNVAVDRPAHNMLRVAEVLFRTNATFTLKASGDLLFLDETRIRYDIESAQAYTMVVEDMRKRGVGAIHFSRPLDIPTLKRFAAIMAGMETAHPEPFFELQKRLHKANVFQITVEPYSDPEEHFHGTLGDERKRAKYAYFRAVTTLKGIMTNIKTGQTVELRKIKRSVQSMVDLILREDFSLLGLTTLKEYDEYLYNHCVNVSVFSLTLGQRLGLPKPILGTLGVAAVFHDLGKVSIPREILDKPTEFTAQEWNRVLQHPRMGVKGLAKLKEMDDLTLMSMIVAFEHHVRHDHSGYPHLRHPRPLHLFTKIVALADQYDAMTSSRVYSRTPYSPDKALSIMVERSGTHFDPPLLKAFVNMVGLYPVGTLLLLDNGELALVFDANPNPLKADRPRILIITDQSGNELEHARTADLAEQDPGTGRYRRNIVKVLDITQYNVDLARYFL